MTSAGASPQEIGPLSQDPHETREPAVLNTPTFGTLPRRVAPVAPQRASGNSEGVEDPLEPGIVVTASVVEEQQELIGEDRSQELSAVIGKATMPHALVQIKAQGGPGCSATVGGRQAMEVDLPDRVTDARTRRWTVNGDQFGESAAWQADKSRRSCTTLPVGRSRSSWTTRRGR